MGDNTQPGQRTAMPPCGHLLSGHDNMGRCYACMAAQTVASYVPPSVSRPDDPSAGELKCSYT